MGTGKKEATRRERQHKTGDGMGNVRTKGENFYRSAKRVKALNMYKGGEAQHNARGDVTKAAAYQGTETPKARVEPNRKWFTNTRVISQDALAAFRGAVEEKSKDPYSYLLKQNKLPMSLINDNKDKERKDGLVQHKAKIRIESEAFGDTFGPKAQRKRPRLAVSSIEDLAQGIDKDHARHRERQDEARYLAGQSHDDQNDLPLDSMHGADAGELTTAREPVFSKGQSKRIWNELYKVIDSSDVVIHVLDARDPLGTRCRSVEKYIREEAPHKHLLFLINKCDLIPTSVAAKWVKLLSQEYPTLAFHASLTNSFGKGTLISLLRQFSALHANRKQISVGFIGYPNTGKSSIINTLRKKKVCTTAPIPGETKVWQYVTLMKRIYLIDCPGIVPPSMTDSPEDILLRGVVRVENVENPAQYIPAVLKKCRKHHLERTYDVKGWESKKEETKRKRKMEDLDGEADPGQEEEGGSQDPMASANKTDKVRIQEAVRFLELLARKGGRLLKGGEADVDGVAKMVLNDFLRGKIPWFSPPPSSSSATKVTTTSADGSTTEKAVADSNVGVAGVMDEDEEDPEVGRDEKLGFTHMKRKRELEEVVKEKKERERARAKEMRRANAEANGLPVDADDDEDEEDEDEDDFEGFDDEEDDESDEDGVGLVEGESSDDESEDGGAPTGATSS
ncbi:nuclear/nucleolar GTP-binding protein [Hortaea werneckii]|nr:nuclear/nucleolar GTP-binding protein [Hortaea werneckii]KAI7109382.1 nuclear/nucleolar GTP-binding protein [Hortaea werneckii]KAI7214274.1 nuclear/nucleolar GTP-binding protein [Hortaea werneckii]KAI7298518.1 nuclear/nucleolar GTP-binding protein [Hortaea werneckii]KAI7339846.1 nuclear/nucleolar GTP-binding protein [Hortaea werneckii]